MALPKKLKAFNVFNDGENCVGRVEELTLPKLTRKTDDYRGGGMNGPIKLDFGQEGIQIETTWGGLEIAVLKQWGVTTHDGVQLRFAGAYQSEDATKPDAVEVIIRGRHTEMDMGSQKASEGGTFKVTSSCSYYKLSINGESIIEIDLINMIEKVNGDDVLAALRSAIGLA